MAESKTSGGTLAVLTREGFRSEILAQFILSALGPVTRIHQEEDFGLDLFCNIMEREWRRGFVTNSYAVQVKSEGKEFEYKGDQFIDWLNSREYPLFLGIINKSLSHLKLYTTWPLNYYLIIAKDSDSYKPERLLFKTDDSITTDLPDPNFDKSIVYIGKPILSINTSDIGDPDNVASIVKILKDWINFDNMNYINRRRGITSVFGYKQWTTNKGLDESVRHWAKNYYFSPKTFDKAKGVLAEAAGVIGSYLTAQAGDQAAQAEKQSLRNYISTYCYDYSDDFVKRMFA